MPSGSREICDASAMNGCFENLEYRITGMNNACSNWKKSKSGVAMIQSLGANNGVTKIVKSESQCISKRDWAGSYQTEPNGEA